MVISKSADLLHKADLTELKKFIKPAAEIKEVNSRKNKPAFRKSLHGEKSRQLKSRLNKVKFTRFTKTRKSIRFIKENIKI